MLNPIFAGLYEKYFVCVHCVMFAIVPHISASCLCEKSDNWEWVQIDTSVPHLSQSDMTWHDNGDIQWGSRYFEDCHRS